MCWCGGANLNTARLTVRRSVAPEVNPGSISCRRDVTDGSGQRVEPQTIWGADARRAERPPRVLRVKGNLCVRCPQKNDTKWIVATPSPLSLSSVDRRPARTRQAQAFGGRRRPVLSAFVTKITASQMRGGEPPEVNKQPAG
jgi:hypothetical protein